MRERFIPALIMLIAGAVTCIIDIYRKADLLSSLKRLLLVLIIFYILGLVAKAVINRAIRLKPETEDETTEEDELEDNTEINPEDKKNSIPESGDE